MKLLSTNKGFTLIEVVIALGVLGFGILAMFSMQLFGVRGNSNANQITQQATWGADGLEQLMSLDYTKVLEEGTRPDMSKIVDANKYNVTWTVTDDSPLDDVSTITVNIASRLDGKQVRLQYAKADPNEF